MKKLTTLLLAAGMVFAATAPASAIDVKFDGQFDFNFARGTNFYDKEFQEPTLEGARQRLRLGMSFVASENLSGYFMMQAGTSEWGDVATGGAFNKEKGEVLSARQVYIDWVIPQTSIKVRMGKSHIGLPAGANGKSYVMHAGIAPSTGVVVSAPVLDNLDVTGYWARMAREGKSDLVDDKYDVFGLYANYKGNGFAIAPYALYAAIGEGTNGIAGFGPDYDPNAALAADAYWLGATATVSAFDPFSFKLGFAYGAKDYDGNVDDRKGFVVDALASYKLGFGTAQILGWYGSGDDRNDDKFSGMMPMVGARFKGGSVAWNGSNLIDNFGADWTNPQGTWGIQLGLTGMSFIQDLKHDFTVTYFAGTNHSAQAEAGDMKRTVQYLTTEDSGVEVAFNSTYKIYKNLTTFVEAGYVFTDFMDRGAQKFEDDWKLAWGFQYKF
ncbi:MAG: outer membrane homotrimeric porin [Mailhella sp.]|nr:outer membrane homotrimeric porin [Mailhella sp.]